VCLSVVLPEGEGVAIFLTSGYGNGRREGKKAITEHLFISLGNLSRRHKYGIGLGFYI